MLTESAGHLILLMAPMGSGKNALKDAAKQAYPEIVFLVSCTTRTPRPGEVEGREYYFLSRDVFMEKVHAGEFVEWAEFGGNLYGTLKSEILEPLEEGRVVLNEIELQGVEQLRALIPKENRTVVYIEAGDWEALRERALKRAPMSDEELEKRHARYLIERESKKIADVIIENYDGGLAAAQKAFVDLVGGVIERCKK
ncbi:guanylate kinase [Patescibacteria group bacterium]|nr:guanylate kinase [Patescibacteria group bacterium]